MCGYDYITVRAPLWLSHSGAKGAGRKGCLKRVVPRQCGTFPLLLFRSNGDCPPCITLQEPHGRVEELCLESGEVLPGILYISEGFCS